MAEGAESVEELVGFSEKMAGFAERLGYVWSRVEEFWSAHRFRAVRALYHKRSNLELRGCFFESAETGSVIFKFFVSANVRELVSSIFFAHGLEFR